MRLGDYGEHVEDELVVGVIQPVDRCANRTADGGQGEFFDGAVAFQSLYLCRQTVQKRGEGVQSLTHPRTKIPWEFSPETKTCCGNLR